MRIRVNDTVKIIRGNDEGRSGKVLSVNHEQRQVVVEGMRRVYKHVRRSQKNPQGGRLSKEMPLPVANVMFVCTKCGQPTRLGARYLDDGSKERFCKKCGAGVGEISPARPAYAKKK